MRARFLMGFFLSVVISGCATLNAKKDAVAKVHRVAVVGFEIVQQMPKTIEFNFGSGKGDDNTPFDVQAPREGLHAEKACEALGQRLGKDMGWSLIPMKSVRADSLYAQTVNDKMKGWRSRPPAGQGRAVFYPAAMLDAWAVERLSPLERQALAKHLQVDALAVARLDVSLKEGVTLKRLVGGGDYHPQANLRFLLFANDGQDLLWQDVAAAGEPSAEAVSHFAGATNLDALNRQVVAAADSAYQDLLKRYRSADVR